MQEMIDRLDSGAGATESFPLALACHRLGQHEKSRQYYAIGVEELQNVTPKDADVPAPWAVSHWTRANLLYREAKAVLEASDEAKRAAENENAEIRETTNESQDQEEMGGTAAWSSVYHDTSKESALLDVITKELKAQTAPVPEDG